MPSSSSEPGAVKRMVMVMLSAFIDTTWRSVTLAGGKLSSMFTALPITCSQQFVKINCDINLLKTKYFEFTATADSSKIAGWFNSTYWNVTSAAIRHIYNKKC